MQRHPAFLLGAALFSAACQTPERDYGRPLPPGVPALIEVTDVTEWPNLSSDWWQRGELLPALDRSIAWFDTETSTSFYPIEGVTHARARASLARFRELLTESFTAYS